MSIDTAIWRRLENMFSEYPLMRGSGASNLQIKAAERALARMFDPDYSEFLRRYGSAMVGAQPVFGLSRVDALGDDWWSVVDVTRHFWNDEWAGTTDWYIVSADGSGNPIGIDEAGFVWTSDHDVGSTAMLAENFGIWLSSIVAASSQ